MGVGPWPRFGSALQQGNALVRHQPIVPGMAPFQQITEQSYEEDMADTLQFLNTQEFYPNEKYRDLLLALPAIKEALTQSLYNYELQQYLSMSWLGRLFYSKPNYEKRRFPVVPLPELERHYDTKADQAKLFCGLCELHDRGLIDLIPSSPFFIRVTKRGKHVIDLLQAPEEPYFLYLLQRWGAEAIPSYDAVTLPHYVPKRKHSTDSFTPSRSPDAESLRPRKRLRLENGTAATHGSHALRTPACSDAFIRQDSARPPARLLHHEALHAADSSTPHAHNEPPAYDEVIRIPIEAPERRSSLWHWIFSFWRNE